MAKLSKALPLLYDIPGVMGLPLPLLRIVTRTDETSNKRSPSAFTPKHVASQHICLSNLTTAGTNIIYFIDCSLAEFAVICTLATVLVIILLIFSFIQTGQTPMSIAEKLGYLSVVEILRPVTAVNVPNTTDEKYRVISPEIMQEAPMSDSEDEGGTELIG